MPSPIFRSQTLKNFKAYWKMAMALLHFYACWQNFLNKFINNLKTLIFQNILAEF
jgi:hypothetical protein